MVKKLVLGAVLAVVVVGLLAFWGVSGSDVKARMNVAGKNVVATVDKLLGELNVKQESINQKMAVLKEQTEAIRKAKHEANVRSELMGGEVTSAKEKLAALDENIKRLLPYLKDGKDKVQINGKTYSKQEVKSTVDSLLGDRESLAKQLKAREDAKATLDKVASDLQSKQDVANERLSKLKMSLDEIASKRLALDALKKASDLSAVGGVETAAQKFDDTEKAVKDLLTSVDAELRAENERFDEARVLSDINATKAPTIDVSTATDTVAKAEKMLGLTPVEKK
jgi:chromosome segregation ATPase